MKKLIWLTGQPGSGKTTLAQALLEHFQKNDKKVINIDGDDLRGFTSNKDYSKQGRENFFSKDYEKPIDNYLSIDTTNKKIKECVDEILNVYR